MSSSSQPISSGKNVDGTSMVPELSKSASSKVPKNHENIAFFFGSCIWGNFFCVSPQNAWRCIFLGSFCHRKVFTKILVEILEMGFLGKNLGMGFLQKHQGNGSDSKSTLVFEACNMGKS